MMRVYRNLRDFFARRWGRRLGARQTTTATTTSSAPRPVVNDAQAYGVAIAPADVAPGGWYWQAVRVHHLTPEENNGNHHIFIDLRDPELDAGNPFGGRVYGARVRVTWDGGEQIATVDKPLNESGTNVPMWRWQVCALQVLGIPGAELPSDRVTGLQTGHPDEAPGNTLFHHSFEIVYLKVQALTAVYSDSIIYGVLRRGAGRTVQLQRADTVVAEQIIGADEAFRFADLRAGEYVVAVAGTAFRSAPARVTGRDHVQLELRLALAESQVAGTVRRGAGRTVRLLRDGVEVASQVVADDEQYRFSELPEGNYRVAVADTNILSPALSLDGTNAAVVDLFAPAAGKLIEHYVLFGPADRSETLANLVLAEDFLLALKPSFGFTPAEAAGAGMVTIIADLDAVSSENEAQLVAGGALVQRVAGTVEQVAGALAERIMRGHAFQ